MKFDPMKSDTKLLWKKGRGKLGVLLPLLGSWKAEADSPVGPMHCTRRFESCLGGHYIRLTAQWNWTKGSYEEFAIYGVRNGKVVFWSFTSDGKRSDGEIAKAPEIHPEAIAFKAKMPAGLARMIYWPRDDGGINWAVEARTKKGWKRFTEHHYIPA